MRGKGLERLNAELEQALATVCADLARQRNERLRMEERLDQVTREADTSFETSPAPYLLLDEEGHVTRLNAAARSYLGRTLQACEGRSFCHALSCRHAEASPEARAGVCEVCPLQRALHDARLPGRTSASAEAPIEYRRDDRPCQRTLRVTAYAVHGQTTSQVLLWLEDLPAGAGAPASRIQALEHLGDLAGGFAHDVNNLLTIILGNVSIATAGAADDERLGSLLSTIEEAALRAADLTNHLTTFARGGAPSRARVDLSSVVRCALDRSLEGSGVTFSCQSPAPMPPILGDPDQLEQALRAIFTNAREAMGDRPGTVTVDVEPAIVTTGDEGGSPGPGTWARLTIHDDGPGIPAVDLPRVLDPFFTTRPGHHGLGLTSAFAIVHRHGGDLAVLAPDEGGTTVVIHLPQPRNPDVHPARVLALEPPPPGLRSPRTTVQVEPAHSSRPPGQPLGRILLMDDERALLSTAGDMLAILGWRVDCVTDGADAASLHAAARGDGDPYDAVILDLTVPAGVGGQEALRAILRTDPDARAIVSSGYHSDPIMANFWEYGFCASIAKPYQLHQLDEVLHSVTGRSGIFPQSAKRST